MPARTGLPRWRIAPGRTAERRVALVIVYSDYSAAGVPSLDGASRNARRVAGALLRARFETCAAVDPVT